MSTLPLLNFIRRYFLTRYKAHLLGMSCTREASAIVDCTDFLLEVGRRIDHA